jgi:transcription initiation factor TFIID subunit 7
MNDRAPIRDRTLVLRILVPGLEARLREKMKDTEEEASSSSAAGGGAASNNNASSGKDRILDLDGVTCEPTQARNRTLWNFHCDGATYPAVLVNLPCPVEIHKTHDHAAYYKSVDVAQMLIVYEDDMALEEAAEKPVEGFPSYYHSGLTPPTRRIVERRFAAREHKAAPPPHAAVREVEGDLLQLMEKIAVKDKNEKSSSAGRRNKIPTLTATTNKVLEEVVEDIVDYEPWMDDYGRQPGGVDFDADEQLCSAHPEVWLRPEAIRQIKDQHEVRNNKNKKTAFAAAAIETETKQKEPKKGIPSKKKSKAEHVDDVTAAALMVSEGGDDIDDLLMNDDMFAFELDEEDMKNMKFDDV